MNMASKGMLIWGDAKVSLVPGILNLNLEKVAIHADPIKIATAREVTLTCSNATIDFDTLMELTCYKDSDSFYYDYDLFALAKVLRPGYADEFYRSRMY
jgi:hypothetical protein